MAEVLICVLGLSRGQGHVFDDDGGVGKSCLCYRFFHPGVDDYIHDHPSILALHEFQSPAVNSGHFLYWGYTQQTLPGRLGKAERTVEIHVVENTVLYRDETSKPFSSGGSGKADNIDAYMKRATGRLESPGKVSYWTRDGISLPDTYRPQRYPTNAGRMKRGFAVVVDLSIGGLAFDAQLQRVNKICQALKNKTYVLVATKMENADPESLEKLQQTKKKLHADIVPTSASCNYNVNALFRILTEKVLKGFVEDIPTFEQAAGNSLAFKTSEKRSFKNFTTKWVHSSTERLEDVERTEQYRACKRAVGKFETDLIFALKLLEVRNREMTVGVNEDPERRREFLEDFIETHLDLGLYLTQLTAKIDDYVSESCEQVSSTSSDSPKTPRRVHHFDNNGQPNSSTTSSPSLKPLATHATPPSSTASISSPSPVHVAAAYTTPDTHSLESFESGEVDYENLRQFTGRSPPTPRSQQGVVTQLPPSPSSPSSSQPPPIAIPPLNSTTDTDDPGRHAPNEGEDPGNQAPNEGEDPGNQATNEADQSPTRSIQKQSRNTSLTHEWVTLPTTAPSTSGTLEKECGADELTRDGPSEDGVQETEKQDAPFADGNKAIFQDIPSGNDTAIHESENGPTASTTNVDRTEKEIRWPSRSSPSGDIVSPDDLSVKKEETTGSTESQRPSQLRPHVVRPKPPPPVKPKPPRAKIAPLTSKGPVVASMKDPLSSPITSHSPSILPPASSPTPKSTSSFDELQLSKERMATPSCPLQSDTVASETPVTSSGEEYVPTDNEEVVSPTAVREPSPLNDSDDHSLAPPVPKRTPGYHIVVLRGDTSGKSVILEPSTGQHSSPEEPVIHEPSVGQHDISPTDTKSSSPLPLEVIDESDTLKPKRKKRRFYDRWVLRKGEKSPEKSLVKHPPVVGKPKPGKGLRHSQSDRQTHRIKQPLHRAPSDPSRPMTPPCTTKPRATFLNMSKRPLPQEPFVLRPEAYSDDDTANYEPVDTMLPLSSFFDVGRSLPPRGFWPEDQEGSAFLSSPQRVLQPATMQKSASQGFENSGYINDDEYPSGSPIGQTRVSKTLPRSLVSSSTQAFPTRPAHLLMMSPSPSSHQPPVTSEPAHPLSIPHPLPPSAQGAGSVRPHVPLTKTSSNPIAAKSVQSPEYDYPLIPGLGMLRALPSRYDNKSRDSAPTFNPGFSTSGGQPIRKSHNTELEQDEYVEMKMATNVTRAESCEDIADNLYQNAEVIKLIRVQRSQSMENLSYYTDTVTLTPGQRSSMNQPTSIPLPARQIKFVIPPRNMPRNPTSPPFKGLKGSTAQSVPPGDLDTVSSQVPHSSARPPQQSQGLTTYPLQPVQSVAPPTLFAQFPDPTLVSVNPQGSQKPVPKPRATTLHKFNAPTEPCESPTPLPRHSPHTSMQQLHTKHSSLTSPPFQPPTQSLPHLDYAPKFSKPSVPGTPGSQNSSSVGTSTWTAENDPSADYYNVISKSFLSPPKPPPQNNSYLDILPD